jgi:hypothetical protein
MGTKENFFFRNSRRSFGRGFRKILLKGLMMGILALPRRKKKKTGAHI